MEPGGIDLDLIVSSAGDDTKEMFDVINAAIGETNGAGATGIISIQQL
jgi:hypothetical protein